MDTKDETLRDSSEGGDTRRAVKADVMFSRLNAFGPFLRPLSPAAALSVLARAATEPPLPWPVLHLLARDILTKLRSADERRAEAPAGYGGAVAQHLPVLCQLLTRAVNEGTGDADAEDGRGACVLLTLGVLQRLAAGCGDPAAAQQLFGRLAAGAPPPSTLSNSQSSATALAGIEERMAAPLQRIPGGTTDPIERSFRLLYQPLLRARSFEEANAVLQDLGVVAAHRPDPLREAVSDAAGLVLKRDWLRRLKPAEVESVLRLYVSHAAEPLEALGEAAEAVVAHLTGGGGDAGTEFGTLSRSTAAVFHKALLEMVAELPTAPSAPVAHCLAEVQQRVVIFGRLVTLCKETGDVGPFLRNAVRSGKTFVDRFLRLLPALDNASFRDGTVPNILKDLQPATRTLQTICGHQRTKPSASLAAHVPPLKRSLEALLYKTKSTFAANSCEAEFRIGNLKARGIASARPKAQRPRAPRERGGDDDEPPDETPREDA